MGKAAGITWKTNAQDASRFTTFGARHSIVGDTFQIAPPGSTTGYYPLSPLENADLADSYISVESVTQLNSNAGCETQFDWQNTGGTNQLVIIRAGGTLTLRRKLSGTNSDTGVTWNGSTMKWWRIRETAGTVYWETSPDGTPGSWTVRRSLATPFSVAVGTIELNAGVYNSSVATPGVAQYRNLNLPTPAGLLLPAA